MRTHRVIIKVLSEPHEVADAASVELPRSAQDVWEYMWSPASSVELFERTHLGVTLPGTPTRAVGEVQAFLSRVDGARVGSLIEVEEIQAGRRAVVRSLTSPFPAWTILTIEPLDDRSCRLTQEFRAELPAGAVYALVEDVHEMHQRDLAAMMSRLSEVMARS